MKGAARPRNTTRGKRWSEVTDNNPGESCGSQRLLKDPRLSQARRTSPSGLEAGAPLLLGGALTLPPDPPPEKAGAEGGQILQCRSLSLAGGTHTKRGGFPRPRTRTRPPRTGRGGGSRLLATHLHLHEGAPVEAAGGRREGAPEAAALRHGSSGPAAAAAAKCSSTPF